MSSADQEYIEFYALSTAATMFANCSISLLAAGMQIFMFIYGLSTFLSTLPSLRKGRLRYIIISGTILVLSVTGTGLDLYVTFKQLYYSGPGIEFIRYKQSTLVQWPQIVGFPLLYGYIATGDALLLYRCYIIWRDVKWLFAPLIVMFTAFIAIVTTNIVRISTGISLSSRAQIQLSLRLSTVAIILTVALNATATALIAYKLIRAQRTFASTLPGRSTSVYQSAVRILIEAAIPLTLFGLLQVFFNVLFYSPTISGVERPNRAFSAASSIFGALYASFAALSPQMIIFRITTGRSFVQNHEVHSSLGPASGPREQFSQPIVFNKPPPTTDTSLSFVETGSAVSRLENGSTAHRGEVEIKTEKPF